MSTWTLVRFAHILALAFFVGGQLLLVLAVAPALRRHGQDEAMRMVARRFGVGSAAALALAVATGAAMASHFRLWDSNILQLKLMLLVVACVLVGFHIASPSARAFSWAVVAASVAVVWLGVKLTYG
jgi:uncharacterized membrane protein